MAKRDPMTDAFYVTVPQCAGVHTFGQEGIWRTCCEATPCRHCANVDAGHCHCGEHLGTVSAYDIAPEFCSGHCRQWADVVGTVWTHKDNDSRRLTVTACHGSILVEIDEDGEWWGMAPAVFRKYFRRVDNA